MINHINLDKEMDAELQKKEECIYVKLKTQLKEKTIETRNNIKSKSINFLIRSRL